MKEIGREEWLKILSEDGTKLKIIDENLRCDHDLVICALKSTIVALQYVDKRLANSKPFILRAIKETPWAEFVFKFASDDLKKDVEVLKEALKKDGGVIAFADKRFQNWVDLAFLALRAQKNNSIKYFGEGLRGNREFMDEVLRRKPDEMRYLADNLLVDIPFLTKVGARDDRVLNLVDEDIAKRVRASIIRQDVSGEERGS